jgi:threonine dehydrogenase-like Zn-dependent dehydrogenase
MRAIVIQSPGTATVTSIPEPIAEPGKILLRVRMIGLCGSDLNTFRGSNPMVSFPRIPGHEIAATIVGGLDGIDGVGNVSGLSPGMNVTLSPYTSCGKCASCLRGRGNACAFNETLGVQRDGGLTEFISIPPEKIYPADLSLTELCLVEPLTVGFHAVARGRVTARDTVAIFGCGGVGLGAIAASSFAGATTIAIDVEDEKLNIARKAGASHVINTSRASLHSQLRELTSGHGPDVIIEAVGRPETFRAAIEEVAFTGRVVYIGYAKEPVAYETKLFVQKELDILGSRNALPEDFRGVIQMLKDGKFPVSEAVSSIIPLEKVPSVFTEWSEKPGKFTKIMVNLD